MLHIGGKLVDLRTPQLMGILNLTPDSFYDGGRLRTDADILQKVEEYLLQGVCIVDLGGYSSRPGAEDVSLKEEIQRIEQPVQLIRQHFPEALLSIDTFRVPVAKAALSAGAAMVNDISGGQLDKDMLPFIAKHKVPYVLMHMRGTPQNMSKCTDFEDLLGEIFSFLQKRLTWLHEHGATDIIIDPGFGFAKNTSQNFILLRNLPFLAQLNAPVLVGLSRKSMIYKTLGCSAEESLSATTALHMYALCQGARVLRVHDPKEARQVIKLYKALDT